MVQPLGIEKIRNSLNKQNGRIPHGLLNVLLFGKTGVGKSLTLLILAGYKIVLNK